MLDFLYDAGSDLVAQDNSGQTAAHYGEWRERGVSSPLIILASMMTSLSVGVCSIVAAQEDNEQCIVTLHELGLVRQEYELKLVSKWHPMMKYQYLASVVF